MSAEEPDDPKITEYHVVYSQEQQQWQVEYEGKHIGFPAWDKRVATSAAKELATKNRPSKVVVHDRKGPVQSEIPYEVKRRPKSS